eukprot:GHVT01077916.1.p2 GENE.GHVT01077916.1~~GHVT01077916.1.p2  ORF type:complete len:161 (-),score=33.41 GHVT01077916.1:485-967(-)
MASSAISSFLLRPRPGACTRGELYPRLVTSSAPGPPAGVRTPEPTTAPVDDAPQPSAASVAAEISSCCKLLLRAAAQEERAAAFTDYVTSAATARGNVALAQVRRRGARRPRTLGSWRPLVVLYSLESPKGLGSRRAQGGSSRRSVLPHYLSELQANGCG